MSLISSSRQDTKKLKGTKRKKKQRKRKQKQKQKITTEIISDERPTTDYFVHALSCAMFAAWIDAKSLWELPISLTM